MFLIPCQHWKVVQIQEGSLLGGFTSCAPPAGGSSACWLSSEGSRLPSLSLSPCMFGCPSTLYVWMPPACLDAPICFNPTHVWKPPVFLAAPYVWILQYAWTPPISLDALLYVWMSPYVWTPPVCLDTPCMFACPYVWMLPVHTQHKESMLCHTKGVSICAHTFGYPHNFECPHIFGYPLYVWMPPICGGWCLEAPCTYTTQRKHAMSH